MHNQTNTPCRKSVRLSRRPRSRKLLASLTTLVATGLAIGTPAAHADYKYYDNVATWISGGVSGTDLSDYSGFDGSYTNSITINSLTFGGNGSAAGSDSNININSFNNLTISSGIITVATNDENNGKYQRINGGGITTNSSNLIINQNGTGGHLEIGSSIFGNMSFTKAGVGFLDLTGYQATYTGATTINGGTLQLSGADNLLPTGTTVTISSATLNLNGHNQTVAGLVGNSSALVDHVSSGTNTLTVNLLSGSNTYGGVIQNSTGFLALVLSGAGTLTLTNANTYTGGTTINGGTLSVSNDNQLGSLNVSQPIYGIVYLNGGTLSANSSFTLSSSRLLKIGPATGTTGGTGTLDAALGQTLTYNGTIGTAGNSGTNNLIKSGAGTVALGGSNTYNGSTTINSGVLSVNSIQGGGAGSGIGKSSNSAANLLFNGGSLQYVGSTTTSTDRLFTLGAGGGTLDASGTGTVTFTGNTTSGTNVIAFSSGTTTTSLTLKGSNTNANTFSPQLTNTGGVTASLTKSGTGSWKLTAANNYTGSTTVNGGTLTVTGSIGSGGLDVSNTDTGSAKNVIIDFNAASGTTQNVSSLSGTVSGTAGNTATVQVEAGNTLAVNQSTNSIYGGNIAGAGNLAKSGSGTLTIAGGNSSYTGATAVNGGTLSGAADSYGSGAVTVASGATVDYTQSGTGTANNYISGTGSATFGGNTSSANGSGGTVNYTGTDSANTTVKSGTLALQNTPSSQAALTGPVAVATGATLQTNGSNQLATNTANGTTVPTSVTLGTPLTSGSMNSGGTIKAAGFSEGTIDPTTAAVTSHLGTLTLAAGTTSTFDFGLNSSNVWAFADSSAVLGNGKLNVLDYVGGQNALYIGTTNSLSQSQLNQIAYNGVFGAFSQLGNGKLTLSPTPEPSVMVTGLVGLGLLGGVIVFRRRQAERASAANG